LVVLLCICGMSWYYPYPNGQPYPIGHEPPPQGFVPGMVPPPPVTFYPHQHEHQQHEQHEQHHHHHHRKKKSKKRKHGIVLPPQGTTDPNPSPTHHANKHEKKEAQKNHASFSKLHARATSSPSSLRISSSSALSSLLWTFFSSGECLELVSSVVPHSRETSKEG